LERERQFGIGTLYIAARTRHPGVLSIIQKICENTVPGTRTSDELICAAAVIGEAIFPGVVIEYPAMIIRNAYTEFRYLRDPVDIAKRKTHDLSATLGDENVRGGGMGVRYVRRTERLSWVMASLSRKRNWPI
jgi:hypothetical protein